MHNCIRNLLKVAEDKYSMQWQDIHCLSLCVVELVDFIWLNRIFVLAVFFTFACVYNYVTVLCE